MPTLPELRQTLALALAMLEREEIIDFNGHFSARCPESPDEMLINAGVRRIVYAGNYPDANSRRFLDGAGVELVHQPQPRPDDTVYRMNQ